MKNADYWQMRFKELEEAQHDKGVRAVANIDRIYRRAEKDIERKIALWYQRLADNNEVTLADAKKMLKGDELKEFKWDVDEYINKGRENALNQEWMKELENASARVHISRLEEIQLQIRQSLEVAIAAQLGETTGALEEVYESSYYHSAYELQKGFGVGVDMNKLDHKKIENVLNKPWAPDEKTFSDRIWDNKTKLINTIHQELTQNLLLGQDPQRAIDAIAKTMDTSKYNAGRLVMTEEAYFSSVAQKDAFKELDVEKYEIVATLDSHTSDICRHMDGKVYDMKEYEAGVTAPPFHVFCRSTTVPYFDDDFGVIGERASRDGDGKTYNVPADMTYEEWEKQFVDKKVVAKSDNDDKIDIEENRVKPYVSKRESTRGQIDTGIDGKVPEERYEEYQERAFEQIKVDTGYSDDKAFEFQDALRNYLEGDYESIETGKDTKKLDVICDGISRMPTFDGYIYRGITLKDEEIMQFLELNPGDTLPQENRISSWSSVERTAVSFASPESSGPDHKYHSVIFECVDNKSGVGLQHISKFGNREAEVMVVDTDYEVVEVNVENKSEYLSKHRELLFYKEQLEEDADYYRGCMICRVKVREKH